MLAHRHIRRRSPLERRALTVHSPSEAGVFPTSLLERNLKAIALLELACSAEVPAVERLSDFGAGQGYVCSESPRLAAFFHQRENCGISPVMTLGPGPAEPGWQSGGASFRDRSSDRGVTHVTAEARMIGVDTVIANVDPRLAFDRE
jgi:hypothetical protein